MSDYESSLDTGPDRCACGLKAEPSRDQCHACLHGMEEPDEPKPTLEQMVDLYRRTARLMRQNGHEKEALWFEGRIAAL